MKQLNFKLFGVLALASMMFLGACNNDDDNGDDPAPTPNLTFNPSGNSSEMNAGDTLDFRVDINHEVDLEKFTISSAPTTSADTTIEDIGQSGFSYDFMYVIPSTFGAGTEIEFTFRVTDVDGEATSKTYTLTVKESGNPLTEDNATLLGAQNSSEGSLYSTSETTVYQLSGFDEANAPKIDFVYYYGATNNATIAAPSDPTVGGADNAVYNIDWDTRNETKFQAINKSFGDINRSTDLEEYRSALEGSSATLSNKLSKDDVVAFLTANGNIGAFEVANIEGTQGGKITINVKVE